MVLHMIGLGLRVSKVYLRLRVHLWRWRRKQLGRFKGSLKTLPGELAEELYESYKSRINKFKLPGLFEIFSVTRRGYSRKRGDG